MDTQIKQSSISTHHKSQLVQDVIGEAVNATIAKGGENVSPNKTALLQSQNQINQFKTNFQYSGLKDIKQIHDVTDEINASREEKLRQELGQGNSGAYALYDAYSAVQKGLNQKLSGIQQQEKFNKILTLSSIDDQLEYEKNILDPEELGLGLANYMEHHPGVGSNSLSDADYHIEAGGLLGNLGVIGGAIIGAGAGGPLGALIGGGLGRAADEGIDAIVNAASDHRGAKFIDSDKLIGSQFGKELMASGDFTADSLKQAAYQSNKAKRDEINKWYDDNTWGWNWVYNRHPDYKDDKKWFGE